MKTGNSNVDWGMEAIYGTLGHPVVHKWAIPLHGPWLAAGKWVKHCKEDCTELWPALFLSASWTLYGGMCYCYSTPATNSTFHGWICISHVIYPPQTSTYQNIYAYIYIERDI